MIFEDGFPVGIFDREELHTEREREREDITRKEFPSWKVFEAVDLYRRHRLANRRIGELERRCRRIMMRDARVRRRCLSKPMTNLLSPFEKVDRGYGGEVGRRWKQSFQTLWFRFSLGWNFATWKSIAWTRSRNIVTRTFESRDVISCVFNTFPEQRQCRDC